MIATDNPSRPQFRDDLPRARQLVTPAWLAQLAAGRPVAEAPAANWRLFKVDEGPPTGSLQGHIPGAGYRLGWSRDPANPRVVHGAAAVSREISLPV